MSEHSEGNTFIKQFYKFILDAGKGYAIILVFGIGWRLGIFDYLKNKEIVTADDNVKHVFFTFDELKEKFELDPWYLESWLYLAVELDFFQLIDFEEKKFETAPYVYEILINDDEPQENYYGNVLASIYGITRIQDDLLSGFKTGNVLQMSERPEEFIKNGGIAGLKNGFQIEKLFRRKLKNHRKNLSEGGAFLDVGCGYGLNLLYWAKQYKKASIVGIDTNEKPLNHVRRIINENQLHDIVKVVNSSVKDYMKGHENKFNVIMLMYVLHELPPDENYRIQFLEHLYHLLKENGVLIVCDPIVSNLFDPKNERQPNFWNVLIKYNEIGYGSRFYDNNTFQKLIKSTSFKKVELIQNDRVKFWAVMK